MSWDRVPATWMSMNTGDAADRPGGGANVAVLDDGADDAIPVPLVPSDALTA
jgi:hypothetical protein